MPVSMRLYPHVVSGALNLRLAHVPFDPENEELDFTFIIRDDESDEDVQTLDLSNSELDWKSLKIELEGALPLGELTKVLPPPSEPISDCRFLVSISCAETRLRKVSELEFADGLWMGSVQIRRDEGRGSIKLVPRLVRKTDLPTKDLGDVEYAVAHGMTIAEGRTLNLRIDPPKQGLNGILRILWEDFEKSEVGWLKSHSSDLFYLDQDDNQPTLYLNAAHAQLKAAMHSKAPSGATAVMRYVASALVAQSVWLQLFQNVVSLVEVGDDAGEDDVPLSGWKRAVLKTLFSLSFPSLPEATQLERVIALKEAGGRSLSEVLMSAAQSAARSSHQLRKAANAVGISGDANR